MFYKFRSAAKRLVILPLLCSLLFLMPAEASAEISRSNYLRTTLDPECYALFEINGDAVSAAGTFKNDRLRRITTKRDGEITSMKFSGREDGSFEAAFTLAKITGESQIILEFESGAKSVYRVKAEGGNWFFPDNGLPHTNRLVFNNIMNIPEEGSDLYLTASGDSARAEQTRINIRKLANRVTAGIDGDYAKARALFAYVASHIYYDEDAREKDVNQAAALDSVLENSRTVCIGLAELYCALLQSQGIDAVAIKGAVSAGDLTYDTLTTGATNHVFSAFWYEEQQRWVWADTCWAGNGKYKNGEYKDGKPHMKFFDITDAALSLDHRADYAQRIPFFPEKPEEPEPAETEEVSETEEAPPETTSAQTTPAQMTTPPATTAAETTVTAASGPPENADSDLPLVILAVALGAGIIALSAYIVTTIKKN